MKRYIILFFVFAIFQYSFSKLTVFNNINKVGGFAPIDSIINNFYVDKILYDSLIELSNMIFDKHLDSLSPRIRESIDSSSVLPRVRYLDPIYFDTFDLKIHFEALAKLLNDTTDCYFTSSTFSSFFSCKESVYMYSTIQVEVAALIEGLKNKRYPFLLNSSCIVDSINNEGKVFISDRRRESLIVWMNNINK